MRRSWQRFRYYGIPSIRGVLQSEGHRLMSPWLRCERCGIRAWYNEIAIGCGWCDGCWEIAWATDPALYDAPDDGLWSW